MISKKEEAKIREEFEKQMRAILAKKELYPHPPIGEKKEKLERKYRKAVEKVTSG